MSYQLNSALSNFKDCAAQAPEGTYEDAKKINEVIGATCDRLIIDIRALGLKANNCDLIFNLEAAIYDYVKRSNPEHAIFPVAEGFGSSMDGSARERVIAQAERNRDFFRGVGSAAAAH